MILHLTQGYEAIIDEADWPRVSRRRWHVHFCRGMLPYARCSYGGWKVFLGRFLLNPPADMEVDHKNGNTLDYRRSNIEVVTPLINMQRMHERQKLIRAGDFKVEKLTSIRQDDIPF